MRNEKQFQFSPINFLYCARVANSVDLSWAAQLLSSMAIRFFDIKITGIFRVSFSLRLSLYISRCQKMSERVVSGDRWRCGRSSNKARGINRIVGWFFIGGCFSTCRRRTVSPLSTHELVHGLFRVVCLAILGDSFYNTWKNTQHIATIE